ncbi:hypothetical protein PFISCL1PPCAC_2316, partial [Pristionchus fissidentatus]
SNIGVGPSRDRFLHCILRFQSMLERPTPSCSHAPCLVISSQLTKLLIRQNDVKWTMLHSSDWRSLIFAPVSSKGFDRCVSVDIEVVLSSRSRTVMSISLNFAFESLESEVDFMNTKRFRVRIDAFFSSIFNENEHLCYSIDNRKLCSEDETKKSTFYMDISLNQRCFRRRTSILSEIHSDFLLVNNCEIPVSREILSLQSDFFLNLFFGDFREKNLALKEIKQVSEVKFRLFIKKLHQHSVTFLSVSMALTILNYSDRFMVVGLKERAMEYLMSQSVPSDVIEEVILVADKVYKADALLRTLILTNRVKSKSVEMQQKHACEKKEREDRDLLLSTWIQSHPSLFGFVIKCHKKSYQNGPVTTKAFFVSSTTSNRYSNYVKIHHLWDHISADYKNMTIDGRDYRRTRPPLICFPTNSFTDRRHYVEIKSPITVINAF